MRTSVGVSLFKADADVRARKGREGEATADKPKQLNISGTSTSYVWRWQVKTIIATEQVETPLKSNRTALLHLSKATEFLQAWQFYGIEIKHKGKDDTERLTSWIKRLNYENNSTQDVKSEKRKEFRLPTNFCPYIVNVMNHGNVKYG